jgi:hypothetical protein
MDPAVEETQQKSQIENLSGSADPPQQQRRFNARPDASFEPATSTSSSEHDTKSKKTYPFSHLCPPGSDLITLRVKWVDDCAYVIPEDGFPDQPLYSVSRDSSDKDARVDTVWYYKEGVVEEARVVVNFTVSSAKGVGKPGPSGPPNSMKPVESSSVNMEFQWGTLEYNLLDNMANMSWGSFSTWFSNTGTITGHKLKWCALGSLGEMNSWVLRCFDVDDEYRDVCTMTCPSEGRYTIQIPVHLIRTQDGLDEMIGVAFAVRAQRETWFDIIPDGEEETEEGAAAAEKNGVEATEQDDNDDDAEPENL